MGNNSVGSKPACFCKLYTPIGSINNVGTAIIKDTLHLRILPRHKRLIGYDHAPSKPKAQHSTPNTSSSPVNRYLRGMTDAKVVAEKLLQANAVKLNAREPFTWASGWKSPIYCDNRRVLSFPFIRDYIKSELCNMVFEKFPDAQLLAGVATAGIAWGAMTADQLKLPYIYVRPKPKEHGLGNQIEGYYEPAQQVVVIEDLVSTGKSSLQVVDVLKNAGLQVVGMVSIFTYGFPLAEKVFSDANLTYHSLTSYPALIELALEKGIVSASEEEILLKWREDPAGWKGVL